MFLLLLNVTILTSETLSGVFNLKRVSPCYNYGQKLLHLILFHGIGLQVGSLGKGRGRHIYWAERYITMMNLLMATID